MSVAEFEDFRAFLDSKVDQYNQPSFIDPDPISIPHAYTKLQDIEITGFWAAILAWGQRVTIINKCKELFKMMDNAPHDFILNHSDDDLKPLLKFKHRTFNDIDTLYFVERLKHFYLAHDSLEKAFTLGMRDGDEHMENGLIRFHELFFELPDAPHRTKKHIATPLRKSACKRINMYLRWMVRQDNNGVDFGLWRQIKPSQLVCPCDLHVERVARRFQLITRKQMNWQTALELTQSLKKYDIEDPVKYDFALFGLGIEEKY